MRFNFRVFLIFAFYATMNPREISSDLIPFLVKTPTLLFVSKYWNEYATKKLLQVTKNLVEKGDLVYTEETSRQNDSNHTAKNLFDEFKKVPEQFLIKIERSDSIGLDITILGKHKNQKDRVFVIIFHKKRRLEAAIEFSEIFLCFGDHVLDCVDVLNYWFRMHYPELFDILEKFLETFSNKWKNVKVLVSEIKKLKANKKGKISLKINVEQKFSNTKTKKIAYKKVY